MAAGNALRWICCTALSPPAKAGTASTPQAFHNTIPGSGKWSANFSTANSVRSKLEAVDPHFTALLYAGDRFEAKPKIESALNEGKIVLIDRYIGSNLAHQTARVPPEKRDDFRRWIEHLEYNIYDLPREDLILYLRVPPVEAQKLVGRKSQRTYTSAKQDLLEASLRHLQEAAAMYDQLARSAPWVTIECFDAQAGAMRSVKEIARDVLTAVAPVLSTAVASKSEKGG